MESFGFFFMSCIHARDKTITDFHKYKRLTCFQVQYTRTSCGEQHFPLPVFAPHPFLAANTSAPLQSDVIGQICLNITHSILNKTELLKRRVCDRAHAATVRPTREVTKKRNY